MLAKLRHPCVVVCYGITADDDGALYQVNSTTVQPVDPNQEFLSFVSFYSHFRSRYSSTAEAERWLPTSTHLGLPSLSLPDVEAKFLPVWSIYTTARFVVPLLGPLILFGRKVYYFSATRWLIEISSPKTSYSSKTASLRFAFEHILVICKNRPLMCELSKPNGQIADYGLARNNRLTVTRGVGTPVYMVTLLCFVCECVRVLIHENG